MNEPSDWKQLASYLSGECTAEKRAELESSLSSDPQKKRIVELMNEAWNTAAPDTEVSDVDRLWKEVAEKTRLAAMPEISTANRLAERTLEWFQPAHRYAVAAVLLVTCSIASYWTQAPTTSSRSRDSLPEH